MPKKIKVCCICKKDFKPKYHRQTICSFKCGREKYRQDVEIRIIELKEKHRIYMKKWRKNNPERAKEIQEKS